MKRTAARKASTNVIPIAPKPEVTILTTENPSSVIVNMDIGDCIGTRDFGAAFEVNPSELPAIAAALNNAVSPRKYLDHEEPMTEGHATRVVTALGYPLRADGTAARMTVELTCHGPVNDDGQVACRITIEQSEWPNAEGEIEIAAGDLTVLRAVLQKAITIARATGVFEAVEWSEKS